MRINGFNGSNGKNMVRTSNGLNWLGVAATLLVGVMMLSMVWGLSEVVRGLDEDLAWLILGAGLTVGWVSAKLAAKTWTAILFALGSGLLFVSMVVGRLWDEIVLLVGEMQLWGTLTVQAIQEDRVLPSLGTVLFHYKDLNDSLFSMFSRVGLWFWRFPRMNTDLISSLMVWSLAIWLAVIWASWFLWRRNKPLEGTIPAFILLGVARSFANASGNSMLVLMGGAIALMVIVGQMGREEQWTQQGVGFSSLIRKNSTRAAMALSVVLVVVSAAVTSIDVDELKERWDDWNRRRNRVSNSSGSSYPSLRVNFDDDRVTLAEQFSKMTRGGLPTDHLVDSGPELADQVVMKVRVEETDPVTGSRIYVNAFEQRYYFKSLTFERYSSQGWSTKGGKIYVYQPEQAAVDQYTNKQRLIKQWVRFEEYDRNTVHVVGELAVIDRLYNAAWRFGDGLSKFEDMFGATVEDRQYEAYSLVPNFRESDLRKTYQNYPETVSSLYLDLPPTVPDRVLDMAYEITDKELNPYDQATAIEQYLRQFPYSLDLPIKPGNVDIADYFLFELQTGYCDYYASTMVVLARAIGLPARLAVGYVGGEYNPETDEYTITGDLAHSWVEIYFPEYGWVTFEPTAGQAPMERDLSIEVQEDAFEKTITFREEKVKLSLWQIVKRVLLGIFLGVALIIALWLWLDILIMRGQKKEKVFAKLYRRLLWFGRFFSIPSGITQTPQEFALEMGVQLGDLQAKHRLLGYLDNSIDRVNKIVRYANRAAYSAEPPDVFDRAQAVLLWRRLRWQLSFAIFWAALMALRPKWIMRKFSSREAV